jgi:hypothetical protein
MRAVTQPCPKAADLNPATPIRTANVKTRRKKCIVMKGEVWLELICCAVDDTIWSKGKSLGGQMRVFRGERANLEG